MPALFFLANRLTFLRELIKMKFGVKLKESSDQHTQNGKQICLSRLPRFFIFQIQNYFEYFAVLTYFSVQREFDGILG